MPSSTDTLQEDKKHCRAESTQNESSEYDTEGETSTIQVAPPPVKHKALYMQYLTALQVDIQYTLHAITILQQMAIASLIIGDSYTYLSQLGITNPTTLQIINMHLKTAQAYSSIIRHEFHAIYQEYNPGSRPLIFSQTTHGNNILLDPVNTDDESLTKLNFALLDETTRLQYGVNFLQMVAGCRQTTEYLRVQLNALERKSGSLIRPELINLLIKRRDVLTSYQQYLLTEDQRLFFTNIPQAITHFATSNIAPHRNHKHKPY